MNPDAHRLARAAPWSLLAFGTVLSCAEVVGEASVVVLLDKSRLEQAFTGQSDASGCHGEGKVVDFFLTDAQPAGDAGAVSR